jgi:NAD(P)-dependent dehydrogenase (short-subunit alcohol dehydrogenase family)
MDLQLNGHKVLITGASQGIGEGLAEAFAGEGCRLHLTARSADRLAAVKAAIEHRHGVEVTTTAIDMTATGAPERIVAAAGDVDVLINNAGVIPGGTVFDIGPERWRQGWALKGFGYVDMIRLVYPRMKARGGGVILNTIGVGGEVCDPEYAEGAAGNASLMALTRALGGTSLEDNIRVVGVNPGPVDTSRIYANLRRIAEKRFGDANRYGELVARYPLKRPARIHEITDLFVFLASFRSGYTSGVIFTVDGGISSRRPIW